MEWKLLKLQLNQWLETWRIIWLRKVMKWLRAYNRLQQKRKNNTIRSRSRIRRIFLKIKNHNRMQHYPENKEDPFEIRSQQNLETSLKGQKINFSFHDLSYQLKDKRAISCPDCLVYYYLLNSAMRCIWS